MPPQFDLLYETLEALGQQRSRAAGWEADDAIGAWCAGARDDDELEIVTGDRDLLQLVRDNHPTVRVLFTIKGVTDLGVFDEAAVLAKYGVPASRYVDFAILRGDPSDGLPGVPGVGEKTAQKLVQAHRDLESILDSAPSQPKRLAQNLTDARDYVMTMRKVVPIRTDVPPELLAGPRDDARVAWLSEHRRLGGPIRRLTEALDQSPR